MPLEVPPCDDRPIWDVWLSVVWLPAVTVADELEIFESLAREPATSAELAARHGFNQRGSDILLSLLTSLRFCVSHLGRYHVTETARTYLLRASPFYSGGVFAWLRMTNPMHESIRGAILKKDPSIVGQAAADRPVEMWESGQMPPEVARPVAAFMHSGSIASATGMALRVNLSGVQRLLDVGGGSGCFCITLAKQNPQLRCTMMDLKPMCEVALEYIAAAGVSDRVGVQPVNMFREAWPSGHDALLFSNIFHDWDPETNAKLAASAFAALPSGGRILVHEMLLDDTGNGPVATAAFSVFMLTTMRGRQLTFQQVKSMLETAGFVDIEVMPTYSYFSVVSGTKR